MNKLINEPDDMISDMLDGYLALYGEAYRLSKVPETMGLIHQKKQPQVSIVIGGGAGNEPWVMGYVGQGLAAGAALGAVYTAPPARAIMNVTEVVTNQEGVIYLSTYHTGDVLNFELVSELATLKGIKTRCLFVSDDIASAPLTEKKERRGVAGIALVVKIAGAACEMGYDLANVYRIANLAADNLRTYSVSSSPGYMPATGRAMFELPDQMIEFGMGFNGEPGDYRTALMSADEIATHLVEKLLQDMVIRGKTKLIGMINGFGFTSLLELCIVAAKVKALLTTKEITLHDLFIDHLFVPQGTGGFSLSLMEVNDELMTLYDVPAETPFFKMGSTL